MRQSFYHTLYHKLATVAVAFLALSCSGMKEVYPSLPMTDHVVAPTDMITFSAFLGHGSRTQLGESMDVRWSVGDKVKVFTATFPQGIEFDLIAGAGTSTGVFEGPAIGDGPFYAVYPSSAAIGLMGTSISVNLPGSQSYAADSFGKNANISAGMADQLDGIHFHNLGGVLQLTISGSKAITGIRVSSYDVNQLFGVAVIDGWDEQGPGLTFEAGQTDDSFHEIYLDCGEGVSLSGEGTTFHLAVPAGTLGAGYRIEVYDSDGFAMVKYAKNGENNQVDRGEIVLMPPIAFQPYYKTSYLLSGTVGAFSNAVSEEEMITICSYVDGESQFAYLNSADGNGTRYLRLEDWDKGFALGFTMPYMLTPGKNSPVTIKSLGLPNISSGSVANMQVIKVSGNRVWMLDPETGNGFILMLVED